jgi:hypothetical protein
MSKWCSNTLEIQGEGIEECLDFCIRRDAEDQPIFDFNSVIPMPTVLEGIRLSEQLLPGLILAGHPTESVEAYLHCDWVKSAGATDAQGIKKVLREHYPDAEEIGRKALAAYKQTGFQDCDNWRGQHWGTQSNAISTIVGHIDVETATINFQTLWS